MKKETILAVFVGLIVGLGVTFVGYKARQTINPSAADLAEKAGENTTEPTSRPSAAPANGAQIILLQPEEEGIVKEKEIAVTGTTFPDSHVVVSASLQPPRTIESDNNGTFSTRISLQLGGNIIVVKVISPDGRVSDITRTVSYYPAELTEDVPLPSVSPEKEASASAKPSSSPKTSPLTPKSSPKASVLPTPKAQL